MSRMRTRIRERTTVEHQVADLKKEPNRPTHTRRGGGGTACTYLQRQATSQQCVPPGTAASKGAAVRCPPPVSPLAPPKGARRALPGPGDSSLLAHAPTTLHPRASTRVPRLQRMEVSTSTPQSARRGTSAYISTRKSPTSNDRCVAVATISSSARSYNSRMYPSLRMTLLSLVSSANGDSPPPQCCP